MDDPPVAVVELAPFDAAARRLWSEQERAAFVDFIAREPLAGDLVPGTGGLRKVRWSLAGKGKRGGARVIYFFHDPGMPLYLMSLYAKSARTDLSPAESRRLAAIVQEIKADHRGARR